MKLDMDQVLKAFEENANPEDSFNAALQEPEKVAEATTTQPAAVEPKGSEKTAAAVAQGTETPVTQTNVNEDKDLQKIAEAEAQGRIMARAFFDEMNKLAVAPVAQYPADPGAIPNNGAVEVGRGEPAQRNQGAQNAANSLIAQLTSANKVGNGEIMTPAGTQALPKIDPQEGNQPLAADAAKAQERAATAGPEAVKTGELALKITKTLYDQYFGEVE